MLRNFVFLGIIVAALDGADLNVIRGLRIGDGQWEAGFEASFLRLPVDCIGDFDAITRGAGGEADALHEARSLGFAAHIERHADRPALHYAHFRGAGDVGPRRIVPIIPVHVPRREIRGILIEKRQPRRGRERLAIVLLVEYRRDVAGLVDAYAEAVVFQ